MKVSDLSPEKLEQLLKEGYTISPNSGRLRKRIKSKKSKPFFHIRKRRKYSRMALWIILLIAFLISLIIVLPELNIVSDQKKEIQKKRERQGYTN